MDDPSMTPSAAKPTHPKVRDLSWVSGLDRLIEAIALWGGGGMLIGLMLLTVIDVALRYGFNAPIYGARDVTKLMLLVTVALSIAYSARTGGQVAIELFSKWMGSRLSFWRELFMRVAALAMLLLLTWRLYGSGAAAARFGEASLALGIGYRFFYFALALGMGLYALVVAVEIYSGLQRGRFAGNTRFPEETP
jgi:TRAP-type C4-dicarboxylate transport system permease small subunit